MNTPQGSEPKIDPARPHEMSWGQWSFEAYCEATTYDGALTFTVGIKINGDDDGEDGLYGKLESSGCYQSIEQAATEAKRLTMVLTSFHEEEGDEDTTEYRRILTFDAIIDAACKEMRTALGPEWAVVPK